MKLHHCFHISEIEELNYLEHVWKGQRQKCTFVISVKCESAWAPRLCRNILFVRHGLYASQPMRSSPSSPLLSGTAAALFSLAFAHVYQLNFGPLHPSGREAVLITYAEDWQNLRAVAKWLPCFFPIHIVLVESRQKATLSRRTALKQRAETREWQRFKSRSPWAPAALPYFRIEPSSLGVNPLS